ncbi:hypothetical protein BA011_07490 [Rhizobium leguminosarum]|uniref:Peptidase S8/S53 domain-containing protein n=2 Tax=Rhizobium leguminosarum TaxID=384 RepID=A0A1B1C786_RHILE|nr:hypothetical protein BA011_07490 [Rhizobium leguminosarum]
MGIRRDQARSGVPLNQRGMAIAIDSRDGPLFVSNTARSTTQGLKLLTMQSNSSQLPRNEQVFDTATFFVSLTTARSMRTTLDAYAKWEEKEDEFEDLLGDDARRPRNFKLFESASSIREAHLRDYWTDDVDRFPRRPGDFTWEVWTRNDYDYLFSKVAGQLEVDTEDRATQFVETTVRNVTATPEQMRQLVRVTGAVVELRGASSFASDYMSAPSVVSSSAVTSLVDRIAPAAAGAPRVTVLDTGVNFANELLRGSLPRGRCHTVSDDWAIADHDGHGTKMAGVALFGDLSEVASGQGSIRLTTALESVVVTAPEGGIDIPARDAIQRAVELVEEESSERVFCLAQTAHDEPQDGRPSSTSAALDQLAYGGGKQPRLFCVAVGNVSHSEDEPYQVADYADRNRRFGVQSPAQALNALAVGAMTWKADGDDLIAGAGDLAPTSRTSQDWTVTKTFKPDIVMEGGNFEIDFDEIFSRPSPENLVLTTARGPGTKMLAMTGETSAATAAASGLAARLMARYPKFRTETIRGMMVHCADWTPEMLRQRTELEQSLSARDSWAALLARYGWGVPNEQRLFMSSKSDMTMIVEDTLQPFEIGDSNQVRLKEMKYFKLPWPTRELQALNQRKAEMRVTLSYFVEPDPHAIARNRHDRYPSHQLKFDVRRFGETDARARLRFNELGEDDDTFGGSDDGWIAGSRLPRKGTIHHDIWRGPAYQLADRDGISIAPIRGWWADIRHSERYARSVKFSLMVSIKILNGEADIYNPVMAAVPAQALIGANVAAARR